MAIIDHHHVAIFAFPFGTHGTPLLSITRRLASLATPNHSIHFSFFTTLNSINSLFPNDDLMMSSNIRPYQLWDGKPQGYVTSEANPLEEIDLFLKAATAPGALTRAVAEAEEEVGNKVTFVMGDAFLWFLGDLAGELGVPWVPCWVSGGHSLCVHMHTHLLRQTFPTHHGLLLSEGKVEEETLDFIPGLSKIRIKDLQEGVVTGDLDSTFSNMLHQMAKALPAASAVCITSCEELDPLVTNVLKSQFPNLFNIGPLNLVIPPRHGPDTHNSLGWLDKQKPNSVVYVSFGSVATPTSTELLALAEALEASGHKFLCSLRETLQVHLPSDFQQSNNEKGLVVPWVPQTEVLAHEAVGVFITHLGYNSMTESIAAEVPMIGRPFFGDHSLNGRLVEAVWEIGLQVEGGVFTKESVLKSLFTILSTEQGQTMRTNIKILKELVAKAVTPDGSSNRNFNKLLDLVTNA